MLPYRRRFVFPSALYLRRSVPPATFGRSPPDIKGLFKVQVRRGNARAFAPFAGSGTHVDSRLCFCSRTRADGGASAPPGAEQTERFHFHAGSHQFNLDIL